MAFIPHTSDDVTDMLGLIGIKRLADLFDEIPRHLKNAATLAGIPPALTELEVQRLMQDRAKAIRKLSCYVGGGAYEHYIPAAIWEIVSRGEWMTAYTPYQAEASQGTLQLLYEFQTMISRLTAMDVANASLYDGASALAEAVLMAVRLQGQLEIGFPEGIHPLYRQTVETLVAAQGIVCVDLKDDDAVSLWLKAGKKAGLVIPYPDFFGRLSCVDRWTCEAHAHGTLVLATVNPLSLGLLKPPGEWGDTGADIVSGEGQSLGIPLNSGGPYLGFMSTRREFVRQMPGRIVGKTLDRHGREGYTLTLQAREQHIRRAKATSNICTNQGLLVTAATIYLSLMGPQGLRRVAEVCHQQLHLLLSELIKIPGVSRCFDVPCFHEVVVRLSSPLHVQSVLRQMADRGFLAGLALETWYPQYADCFLLCVTETKTEADLKDYLRCFREVLAAC